MRFTRIVAIALLAAPLLAPLAAQAQDAAAPAPATGTTTAQPAPKPAAPKLTAAQRFKKRFETANSTHDGHLTLDQAKAAKWTAVVHNFAKVDIDQKGYVTVDELRAYYAAQRAAKAKPATAPATTAAPSRS